MTLNYNYRTIASSSLHSCIEIKNLRKALNIMQVGLNRYYPHPLRKRAWCFIWTTLNTHHTRMGCFVPSLDDIVLMVLEKKIFLKCLKLFLPLSPFGRGCYLNTPEFPLYQRVLCAKVVLEKVVNFLYVAIISPFKVCGPLFEWTWIPISQVCFRQVWLKLGR